jgi:DNA-binding IscR family transcriptional regulator
VPSRLVSRVLEPLIQGRLVLEVAGCNQIAYTPGRPPENITYHDILQIMRVGGGQELETRHDRSRQIVNAEFRRIQEAERQVASAVTLKELVARVDGEKERVE